MTAPQLTPPTPSGNNGLDRWLNLLWRKLTATGSILWSQVSKVGSNLTDIETRNHVDLQNIQGGTTNQYYHLTSAEYTGTGTGVFVRTSTPSIATPVLTNPSFSGATANMGTVTTIDINGGTIDGTNIGATTPGTGAFTTLTTTGAIELGNASDTTLARSGVGVMTIEGVEVVTLTRSQVLTNKSALAATNTIEARSGPGTSQFSHRNKIINGDMRIDQRNAGAAQTITGGASPLAYNADRWQVRSAGANVTVQRVAGTGNSRRMRFTGAASVTNVALHQRIEASNSQDLVSSNVTVSFIAFSTSLTSLTVALYRANTEDVFGTWSVPTVTLEDSDTVTINTNETRYSVTLTLSANATTGLELRITGGALLGTQTLTVGDVQLEEGSVATPFEHRPIGYELALCQRYYWRHTAGAAYTSFGAGDCATNNQLVHIQYPVTMRVVPTPVSGSNLAFVVAGTITGATPTFDQASTSSIRAVGALTATAGQACRLLANNNASAYLEISAEL